MNQKKVSVILVNYNGLQDTIECINSLNKSTYSNFDIIVMDNHSTEDSTVLETYDRVIYKRLSDNFGFGVANNIGAEYALEKGADYLLLLNNDTVVDKFLIEKFVSHAKDHVIETGAMYYYNFPEELWYGGGTWSRAKGNFRHQHFTDDREVSFATGCCLFIPRNCVRDIGLFDDKYFMYCEDADFSIKALKHGYKLFYICDAKLWHKVGKSIDKTIGLKDYYITRNRLYLMHKYKKEFGLTTYLYFGATRLVYIIRALLKGKDIAPIIDGIKDYRANHMGRKDYRNRLL